MEDLTLKTRIILRRYDTKKYELAMKFQKQGAPESVINDALKRALKPQFFANTAWRIVKRLFGRDVRINHLTGRWSTETLIGHNLVTTRGKQLIVGQINGVTAAPATAIAIGSDTTAAAAGNTALGTEITTNGGQRGAATCTLVTTTTTNDTAQFQKTFTFTGPITLGEHGLFDNNTSGGNMLSRKVYSPAQSYDNGDSLQITHQIKVS